MFVQMLEGLSKGENEVLVKQKDKKLHQVYKGLSAALSKKRLVGMNNSTIK